MVPVDHARLAAPVLIPGLIALFAFSQPLVAAGAVCGDGMLEASEFCDDGDLFPGDGCSADCQIESGWAGAGEPSVRMLAAAIFSDGFEWGSICAWSNQWYPDSDGDGYGSAGGVGQQVACPPPSDLAPNNLDCDDSVGFGGAFYPGAPEICDGLDNDCDGEADEDFWSDWSYPPEGSSNSDFSDLWPGPGVPDVNGYPDTYYDEVWGRILPEGDTDWFAVPATEIFDDPLCELSGDTPIKADVTITPPAGVAYKVCVCWSSCSVADCTPCDLSPTPGVCYYAIGIDGETSSTVHVEMPMNCGFTDYGYLDILVTPVTPAVDSSCSEYDVGWDIYE